MFSKNKFLAGFLFSALTGASALAQTAATPQTAPKPETAPQVVRPRTGGQMQIFTNDGGSYLGVQSQEVTKENFVKFGLREVRGVAIEKVIENSPAAQAGLQNGDVIIRFEGEEVTGTRKLNRLISEVAPDHQAKITVLRGGSERDVTVTMGKRQMPTFQNGAFTMTMPMPMPMGELRQVMPMGQLGQMPQIQGFPQGGLTVTTPFPMGKGGNFTIFRGDTRQIGVSVQSLGQLGDYFGVSDGKGLLVNNVRPDSPAAKSGLKAGDVIVEADGKAVTNMMELTRTINEKKEGDVNLTIIRNKNRQTVRVTPEKMKGNAPTGFFMQSDGTPDAQRQFQMLFDQPDEDAPKVQTVQPAKRVE